VGQDAFYRQIAQADQRFTDEIEPHYGQIDIPVGIFWGTEDTWIPVDRAHRLKREIPGSSYWRSDLSCELVHDVGVCGVGISLCVRHDDAEVSGEVGHVVMLLEPSDQQAAV
jgi:pimeloyl-ACP methyl ester carboxylesterase